MSGPVRVPGLTEHEIDGEVLVLNAAGNSVMTLRGKDLVAVWKACDGHRDVAAIVARSGVRRAGVDEALKLLRAGGLLSTGPRVSRRVALAGLVAAGVG